MCFVAFFGDFEREIMFCYACISIPTPGPGPGPRGRGDSGVPVIMRALLEVGR